MIFKTTLFLVIDYKTQFPEYQSHFQISNILLLIK